MLTNSFKMRFIVGLLLTFVCVHAAFASEIDVLSNSNSEKVLEQELPSNPLDCQFEDSELNFCEWKEDPRDTAVMWTREWFKTQSSHAVCLHLSPASYRRRSRYRPSSVGSRSFVGRLWSATIMLEQDESSSSKLITGSLQCIRLVYRSETGSSAAHDTSPKLALLRHSSGSCKQMHRGSASRKTSTVCDNEEMWISNPTGTLTAGWNSVLVDLNLTDGPSSDYKLILEGTIPAGYPDARICVDNITSYTEPCSALQKVSKTVSTQWTWAQYFGITFVTALVLGLTIPILFIVILLWACRRRHQSMHSSYTNNKLFSTNLWYYIGGKELCDDSNGYRGSTSLLRGSNKAYNGSGTGTTGTLYSGPNGPDVMDLPDVVIPGGRVVAFNYTGNTLGPGGTMRHMQQSMTTGSSMQPMHGFNTMGPQNMATGMGTVSSQSSGATPNTGMRQAMTEGMPQTDAAFGFQQMLDRSGAAAQIPPQQQQQQQHLQQQPLLQQQQLQQQAPMIMSQSALPGTYPSDQMIASATNGQFNVNVAPVATSQSMQYPNQSQPAQQTPQPQQQQQQPFVQAQNNIMGQYQPMQQPANQQLFPVTSSPLAAPAINQTQTVQLQQTYPQQQQQQQQPQTQQQQQQPPLPPPPQQSQSQPQVQLQQPQYPQQQQQPQFIHQQQSQLQQQPQPPISVVQTVNPIPAAPLNQSPTVNAQQTPQHRHSVIQPIQLPPPQQQHQQQQHQSFANQQILAQSRPTQQSNIQPVQPQPQHQLPPPINNPTTTSNNQPAPTFISSSPVNQQPIAAVTPTTRAQVNSTPISSPQSDSLTEADQQAAMAALYAATEGTDSTNVSADTYATANNATDLDSTYTLPGEINEDHPPPGYDEAIGLVLSRGNSQPYVTSAAAANYLQANTMVKPAVPVPTTNSTPPPALPPRRLVNGMGLEDVDDTQPSACLSLAERYGLPVAEI